MPDREVKYPIGYGKELEMNNPAEWGAADSGVMHRFRSRILGLVVVADRLIATTERGVYRLDKNGKRWRKVKCCHTSRGNVG